jgi:hypothetical protein
MPLALTRYMDSRIIVAQVLLFVFWIFFIALILSALRDEARYAERVALPRRGDLPAPLLTYATGSRLSIAALESLREEYAGEALAARLEMLFQRHRRERLAPTQFMFWLLPLTGFMGTVIGISFAIEELGRMAPGEQGAAINEGISRVLGGLHTAFDTTLVGLVFVIPTALGEVYTRHQQQAVQDEILAQLVIEAAPSRAQRSLTATVA